MQTFSPHISGKYSHNAAEMIVTLCLYLLGKISPLKTYLAYQLKRLVQHTQQTKLILSHMF